MVSGGGLSLGFPGRPHGLSGLVHSPLWEWIALIPLLVTLRCDVTAREAFRRGWITGAVFAASTLYWVGCTRGGGLAVVGGAGLLSVYLGVFTGLFAAAQRIMLQRWADKALLAAPVLWMAQEYLVSLGQLGFPWLVLANAQAAWPRFVQYAALTGAYGVSGWVVLLNVLLLLALRPEACRRVRAMAGLTLLVIAVVPWMGSFACIPRLQARRTEMRAGLIQPNLTPTERWAPGGEDRVLRRLGRLSVQSVEARDSLDLLVWPENAVPCRLPLRPRCREWIQALVDTLGVPVLTGALDADARGGRTYNAAFYLQPHRHRIQRYAKMHLVPFGERTPFRDYLPLLRGLDWSTITGDLGSAEFSPGTQRTIFAHARVPFAVLICFEAVFPDFTRRSVAAGARLLVNITDDSWFGDTAGPYQHAQLVVLRSVENRTPLMRCAETGLSFFVDAYGRTFARTELGTEAIAVHGVTPGHGGTWYTRHGDVFAQGALLGSVLLVLWARATPIQTQALRETCT